MGQQGKSDPGHGGEKGNRRVSSRFLSCRTKNNWVSSSALWRRQDLPSPKVLPSASSLAMPDSPSWTSVFSPRFGQTLPVIPSVPCEFPEEIWTGRNHTMEQDDSSSSSSIDGIHQLIELVPPKALLMYAEHPQTGSGSGDLGKSDWRHDDHRRI